MKIIVDADACPHITEIIDLGKQHNVPVLLVCDYTHNLSAYNVETIVVEKARDSADFKILQLVTVKDMVITQDTGLAAMVLAKKASAMHYNGLVFSNENIDRLLAKRHIGAKLRRQGKFGKSAFPKEEQGNFKENILEWICQNKTLNNGQ